MADYNSNYTGPQIDAAIDKMYESIPGDRAGSYYALGVNQDGNLMNIRRKECMFTASGHFSCNGLNTGDIICSDINCNKITTSANLILGQSNGNTTEGGEIQFLDSTGATVGYIDTFRDNAGQHWMLRAHASGKEHMRLDLTDGHMQMKNRFSGAWIYCGTNATIYSSLSATDAGAIGHLGMKTPSGNWTLVTYNNERLYFVYCTDANINSGNNVATANIQFGQNGKIYGSGGWGDYAELRTCVQNQPGRCVYEKGDGSLEITSERLTRGSHIISDTYGMLIGPEGDNKVAVGVSGRVLAYIYEGREEASKHIGWPVCSGPNGTVSIMTEEEEQKYPSRIIGTISEIPTYEIWSIDNVQVNGRIWIHIK